MYFEVTDIYDKGKEKCLFGCCCWANLEMIHIHTVFRYAKNK